MVGCCWTQRRCSQKPRQSAAIRDARSLSSRPLRANRGGDESYISTLGVSPAHVGWCHWRLRCSVWRLSTAIAHYLRLYFLDSTDSYVYHSSFTAHTPTKLPSVTLCFVCLPSFTYATMPLCRICLLATAHSKKIPSKLKRQ